MACGKLNNTASPPDLLGPFSCRRPALVIHQWSENIGTRGIEGDVSCTTYDAICFGDHFDKSQRKEKGPINEEEEIKGTKT